MSTAQVANSGIVGSASRILQPRYAVASSAQFVDPLTGAYAPPPREQTYGFDDDPEHFVEPRPRRRQGGPFQDRVVSFGGVLVSQEVGATIMQAQAANSFRSASPSAVEAGRGIAVYEFNQALMGTPEPTANLGFVR